MVSEPVWPEDPGWRIRFGGGLLAAQPLSDTLREAHAREDLRERAQAERDAELTRERALERRWDLQRQGVEAHSVGEVLARASVAQDRADRRAAVDDERYRGQFGLGRPHHTAELLGAAKAEREARQAEAEATPASKADVGKVSKSLAERVHQLTRGIMAITGENPLK